MIKIVTAFTIGIAVGVASASIHSPSIAHAEMAQPTPYSAAHSAIPTPSVAEALPPTF